MRSRTTDHRRGPAPRRPHDAARLIVPDLPPPPDSVVAATPSDLAYVVALPKRHANALGFIPRVALAEKIARGQVVLARENGEPAGYLHHGSLARPEVRVFQAAIQYDARRRGLGLELVGHLLRRAAAAGARGVSLRCLDFLEANEFWGAAGFELLTTEPGGKGTLNVWVKRLASERPGGAGVDAGGLEGAVLKAQFSFSSRIHPCPGCGEATTDTWVRGARRLGLCAACGAAAGRNCCRPRPARLAGGAFSA